jgi:uncharacterized membrane protein
MIMDILRERYLAHEITADQYASLSEDAKLIEHRELVSA